MTLAIFWKYFATAHFTLQILTSYVTCFTKMNLYPIKTTNLHFKITIIISFQSIRLLFKVQNYLELEFNEHSLTLSDSDNCSRYRSNTRKVRRLFLNLNIEKDSVRIGIIICYWILLFLRFRMILLVNPLDVATHFQ